MVMLCLGFPTGGGAKAGELGMSLDRCKFDDTDDGEDGAPAKKRARVERITVEGRDTDVTVLSI